MEKTEKFFIFTWKELIVIVLLVFTLLGFFFTLGLHYGKKISVPLEHAPVSEASEKLEESPESIPPRETLEAGHQHEKAVGADTIKEATKEEVANSEGKIDQPKAVALPTEKSEVKPEEKAPDKPVVATYSVQLGSYVTKKEAQQKVKLFSKKGVETEIYTVEVNHQTRFRVIIPGFKTRASAEARGKDLKHKHKIENYIVIK